MKLLTIDIISNNCEILGLVTACHVESTSMLGDAAGTVKNWVGGEIVTYSNLLERAVEIAKNKIIQNAKAMGATTVVGVRFFSADIVPGGAEVVIYGTAIKELSN